MLNSPRTTAASQRSHIITCTFILLCCLHSLHGKAQFSETIFYDTLTRVSSDGYIHSGITEGKYLYLAGGSFSQQSPLPTLVKMDTAGNVIWTAIDAQDYRRFPVYYGFENFKATCYGTFKSGGNLFTIAAGATSDGPFEVWNIADSSGQLLWKTSLGNKRIHRIVNYSATELLAVTGSFQYEYHVIDKQTGVILFSKHFGTAGVSITNNPNIYVDDNRNILLTWDDTCRKFRDSHLQQLVWTSHIPNSGSLKMIDRVIQDGNRYLFLGRNNARYVDTLTGNTVWFRPVQVGFVIGVQSGGDGDPKDVIIHDSLIYTAWTSPYVGGVDLGKGFTITIINKNTGIVHNTVAYDFTGTPADPPPPFTSELDWPMQMVMDSSRNIYMVGSYDRAPGMESPGNWGIMKINGITGAKMYEATITEDASRRMERSQGRFIYYYEGKIFSAGNLEKSANNLYAHPVLVSIDTTGAYHERYRKNIVSTLRYPSSLEGLTSFSNNKMTLLKKVGRSGVIEMRDLTNQLIWSKTFSRTGAFVVPQLLKNMGDTSITAAFLQYPQDTLQTILPYPADSVVFVRLDSNGNIKFRHSIKLSETDTLQPAQVHLDPTGTVNFIYRKKNGPVYTYSGYTLHTTGSVLSALTGGIAADTAYPSTRLNIVQHYGGDTMLVHYHSNVIGPRADVDRNTQSGGSYPGFFGRSIRYFAKIYSTVNVGAYSTVVTGVDSNGHFTAARYNYRLTDPFIWRHTQNIAGAMLNADTSLSSLYALVQKDSSTVTVSKIGKTTGNSIWNLDRNLGTGKLQALDFRFNTVKHYFTWGGYYYTPVYTPGSGSAYQHFFFVADSSGNIVTSQTRAGYGLNESKIRVVEIFRSGNTAYGGTLSTSAWGTAGFYTAQCLAATLVPSITISGTTTTNAGQAVTITANVINGGANPSFQWQDSTAAHSWQNISGATNGSISYTPAATGDRLRCQVTSSADCLAATTATSSPLSFTVNTVTAVNPTPATMAGIKYYPNPANSFFVIDSLRLSDNWRTLDIKTLDGRTVAATLDIRNRTKVNVDLSRLPAGVYIISLRRNRDAPVYIQVIRLP